MGWLCSAPYQILTDPSLPSSHHPHPYLTRSPITLNRTLYRLEKAKAALASKEEQLTAQKMESARVEGAMLGAAAAQGRTVPG